jgi:hypothetical protein
MSMKIFYPNRRAPDLQEDCPRGKVTLLGFEVYEEGVE